MLKVFANDGSEERKSAGVRLAWIKKLGDDLPEKTVYLKGEDYEEDDEDPEESRKAEDEVKDYTPDRDKLLPVKFYTAMRNISPYNKDLLRKAIRTKNSQLLQNAKPERQADYLKHFYDKAEESIELLSATHISLERKGSKRRPPGEEGGTPDAHVPISGKKHGGDDDADEEDKEKIDVFAPVPMRDVFQTAIFGPTGVGKSYWAATTLMHSYNYYYPDNTIFIWTFFEHDKAFDKLENVQYIKIDEELISDPPHASEFENSLCVFDDVESLPLDMRSVVLRFRDQCLATGRKYNLSVIAIAHEIMGGNTSKTSILECENVVLFNKGFTQSITNLLQKKFGMDKATVNFVLNSPTRWVMVKRSYPQVIVTPREIKLVNPSRLSRTDESTDLHASDVEEEDVVKDPGTASGTEEAEEPPAKGFKRKRHGQGHSKD
jgi:hypothetical protein